MSTPLSVAIQTGVLAPREAEALRYICEGLTGTDAARVMGIKEVTVRKALEKVRLKLQAETTYHAIVMGVHLDIIQVSKKPAFAKKPILLSLIAAAAFLFGSCHTDDDFRPNPRNLRTVKISSARGKNVLLTDELELV